MVYHSAGLSVCWGLVNLFSSFQVLRIDVFQEGPVGIHVCGSDIISCRYVGENPLLGHIFFLVLAVGYMVGFFSHGKGGLRCIVRNCGCQWVCNTNRFTMCPPRPLLQWCPES